MAKLEDVNAKLDYVEVTKALIKQAIENKGQAIEESDTFREFVNKISNIKTTSIKTTKIKTSNIETSLIEIAEQHRSSYDDERVELHKIETLRQAISYFTNYGFEVTEMC